MKKLLFPLVLLLVLGCRNNEVIVTPPEPEVLQQPYQTAYTLTDSQKYIYDINACLLYTSRCV